VERHQHDRSTLEREAKAFQAIDLESLMAAALGKPVGPVEEGRWT